MRSSFIRVLFVLTRFPVSLAVTLTAFAAMVMQQGEITGAMAWPLAGIFLLASGASAFNQYQEWPYDEKMERTRRRPVPSRRISPADATRIAMITIAGGLIILFYYATGACLILGVVNLLWYNGLYTWLKRKTAFAVVPGALTGAIPVFMGWTALGGELMEPTSIFLAFFIFLWQMPHFWLLMLKYGEEYHQAGFRVVTTLFTHLQVRIIVMAWLIASSVASYLFVFFGIIENGWLGYLLVGLNGLLLIILAYQLFAVRKPRFRVIFLSANLFMFLVMMALIADAVTKSQ